MLTLGISTSSGQFALVLGEDGKTIYNSKEFEINNELDDMLQNALSSCGKEVKDINSIIVDIGPGGTSRVRTGVAFANSLSFASGIPVYPVSSMELAGVDAGSKYNVPVIATVKSIKGNAYIGLYNKGQVTIKYGPIEEIPMLIEGVNEFAVVGFHRDAIINLPALKNKIVIDSEMMYGDVSLFIEKEELFKNREGIKFPYFAQPVTENTI
jgi:Inactive homolog of metal-dependent proteases, putative molecular chaperone